MNMPSQKDRQIFENLFVLEAANNLTKNLGKGTIVIFD
jgi:hypothetical protein